MADVKISALNALGTAPAAGDLLPVVDVSGAETKKLRIDELFTNPNVTGTVTADGLTVSNATGSATPTPSKLSIQTTDSASDWSSTLPWGQIEFYSSDASSGGAKTHASIEAISDSPTGGFSDLVLKTNGGSGNVQRMRIDAFGDISFYEDTGTTAKFFWDASAERLGIGTTSPTSPIHIQASGATATSLSLDNVDTLGREWRIVSGITGVGNGPFTIYDADAAATRFAIDSSGNVGIGTTSPARDITISSTTNPYIGFEKNEAEKWVIGSDASDRFIIYDAVAGLNRVVVDDATGSVGIGAVSPTQPLHVYHPTTNGVANFQSGDANVNISLMDSATTAANYVGIGASGNDLTFISGNGSERARIDSSGNLLVGKTVNSIDTVGALLRANGQIGGCADGAYAGVFSRNTSDGDIVLFRKDGTTVGSIGSLNGVPGVYFGVGSTAISVYSGALRSVDGTTGNYVDNTIDIGKGAARFKDIYASNGTIQTSDRNEKQDIEALSEAEQRIAVACKGLLRKFRWKSAVEEKGDDARIHFGIIAQDLQDAFTAEGLDAGRYAMFIHSTWTDEETGEERSRMGVRYSELLAFIIAAI